MSEELNTKEQEILDAINNGASDDSLKSQFGATDEDIAKLRGLKEETVEETTEEELPEDTTQDVSSETVEGSETATEAENEANATDTQDAEGTEEQKEV